MSKTVKGARIRHKRSDLAGKVPTIPTTDDHTTGWKDTDIYIGEFYMNTSVSTPGVWFRESTGITQIATLDKTTSKLPYNQLTNNVVTAYHIFSTDETIIDVITGGTQFIIVSGVSTDGDATSVIDLTELEATVCVVYATVKLNLTGGISMTEQFIDSLGSVILTHSATGIDVLRGISLMWNGSSWFVISDVDNA
jgi:hypothetical protein